MKFIIEQNTSMAELPNLIWLKCEINATIAIAQGQVRLAVMSSKDKLENKATSKAEYTNTQQDLPDYRYT